jgi:hypothetical protein
VGEGAAVNLYSAEQESASDMAERSAQFSAFAASLPFTSLRANSGSNYNAGNNDDPLRRSTNSLASDTSHDHVASANNNGNNAKITLPTIVETQGNRDSSTNNAAEKELDEKNKRSEKSR